MEIANNQESPILKLIDHCQQCKRSVRAIDILIVETGTNKIIKLCPSCHFELWKKYILPGLEITKKQQSILQNDALSIKIYLEQYAKKFKQL